MMRSHEFRRRPDGSIDFDFYRAHAMVLRRQACATARPRKWRCEAS
jgi:hypothetical protein